jgi:hypothetical protein
VLRQMLDGMKQRVVEAPATPAGSPITISAQPNSSLLRLTAEIYATAVRGEETACGLTPRVTVVCATCASEVQQSITDPL